MELPDTYPADQSLLAECETLGSGADIHDRNKWKSQYQFCIREYNLNKNRSYWFKAVDAERMLAGIVAEARAKKFRGLPMK